MVLEAIIEIEFVRLRGLQEDNREEERVRSRLTIVAMTLEQSTIEHLPDAFGNQSKERQQCTFCANTNSECSHRSLGWDLGNYFGYLGSHDPEQHH